MAITIFNIFGDSHGRMTIEQFVIAREKLGFSPPSNQGVNIGGKQTQSAYRLRGVYTLTCPSLDMLLVKRMDSDGDGYISAQDMLTAQVAALHQPDNLLHAVFRIYLEAVWYPGRQLNVYHAMKELQPKTSFTIPAGKFGLHFALVRSCFDIRMVSTELLSDKAQPMMDSNANVNPAVQRAAMNEKMNVVVPPKYITEKNVSAIFERLGYDASNGKKVFAILCETIRRMETIEEDEDEEEEEASGANASSKAGPSSPRRTSDKHQSLSTKSALPARKERMDVRDFIRVCKIDDVLVQVLFKRSNQVLMGMCRRAEERLRHMLESNPNMQEDVALYAIVEDELRAQMQRVAQMQAKK